MGTRKDYEELGVIREITFSTYRKAHLLRNPACAQIVCDALAGAKARTGFSLYAYAVMSNHVHLVLSFETEAMPLARILSSIKTSAGRRLVTTLQQTDSPLLDAIQTISRGRKVYRAWMPGGGYDRSLYDVEAVWNSVEYVHNNPVKARLVDEAGEYEFSSARYVEAGDYSVIDPLPRLFKY